MKTFKDYLREASADTLAEPPEEPKKKTQVKDKNPLDNLDVFGSDFGEPSHANITHHKPEEPQRDEPQAGPQDPRGRVAGRDDTHRRTAGINVPGMADRLANMRDIAPHPDDVPNPEPRPPEDALVHRVDPDNLPAQANRALQAGGVQTPTWHRVANLPGNMKRAIQSLGRHLFGSMTRTPTEDIQMVANLSGQGPNTTAEVRAVASWIRNNGDDLGPGNIEFDTSIPGYNAEIHNYVAAGIHWLLVRDEFGEYIYSWPEQDSVGHQNAPAVGHNDRPRLGR